MQTNPYHLQIEKRLRALGYRDPLQIADTIREVIQENPNLDLKQAMDRLDLLLEARAREKFQLDVDNFPDIAHDRILLEPFFGRSNFQEIAHILKDQFSSRNKGFGKMVPRPIDFAGFVKLSEDRIDRKTLIYTTIFWVFVYSLIFYYLLY